jgi:hypothetical protein
MPHINRIRVNNVKYNFGTQFYDDFVMRFDGKNALYDLANGGGKSVLMLLLFQNLIPNCTLDDKQPIEKLFRTGEGSTSIHSLVEWKLDDCDILDGYRYMLTGFCARKAKDDEEHEAGSAASIDYYNYVIFYQNYNDNDIVNLPLSRGKERMTYVGLRSYLKSLEHNDYSLRVHIFDRKGEYQRFISRYGLYESQWEIIRGINKTEGHVRTYFENTYKTTRKVVEDLFIEEIIQKAFIGKTEGDKEDMAQTLMAIREKLLELSKKRQEIASYDKQAEAMEVFRGRIESLVTLYQNEDKFRYDLVKTYHGLLLALKQQERQLEATSKEQAFTKKHIEEIARKLDTVKVQKNQEMLKHLENDTSAMDAKIQALEADYGRASLQLSKAESMRDYAEYEDCRKNAQVIRGVIESSDTGDKKLKTELARMAAQAKYLIDGKLAELEKQLGETSEAHAKVQSELQLNEETLHQLDMALAVLENNLERSGAEEKAQIHEIAALRQSVNVLLIEGTKREVDSYRTKDDRSKKALEDVKDRKQALLTKLTQMENERHEAHIALTSAEYDKKQLDDFFEMLEKQQPKAEHLLKVYTAANYGQLKSLIYGRYKKNAAELFMAAQKQEKLSRYVQQLKEKNPVQVSDGVRDVMDYLKRCHNISCMAGCEYLKTVESEDKQQLIENMPFLPYAVLVRSDFSKLNTDAVLFEKDFGDYQIPIVRFEAVMSGKPLFDENQVVLTGKNKKLYTDDETIEEEIAKVEKQLEELKSYISRMEDQEQTYQEDLAYLHHFMGEYYDLQAQNRARREQCEKQVEEIKASIEALEVSLANGRMEVTETENKVKEAEATFAQTNEELAVVTQIYELNQKLEALRQNRQQWQAQENKKRSQREEAEVKRKLLTENEAQAGRQEEALTKQQNTLTQLWQALFLPYMAEAVSDDIGINGDKKNAGTEDLPDAQMTLDELEVAFTSAKTVYESGQTDIADKKKLLENYEKSMQHYERLIESRHMTLQELDELKANNLLEIYDDALLHTMKADIDRIQQDIRLQKAMAEDARGNWHRLTGRVENAIAVIEEKYGAYKEVELKNMDYDVFVQEYTQSYKQLGDKLTEYARSLENAAKNLRQLDDLRKDIERLFRSVGVTTAYTKDTERPDADFRQMSKQLFERYEQLRKEEDLKKAEFERQKDELAEILRQLKAFELCDEIRYHIQLPTDSDEAEQMYADLKETISIIMLEKDRVYKGIEDMVKIKQNFETQCLQRCIDIRMELSRLPKMSVITLDGEDIQMMTLKIPYVKEEFYSQRMSEYIDRIVEVSDNLASDDERLKYLRNQLSWKHLFSVIVTDMDSIRLSLYKRERIREQSRFLKYEEAVGSTGQSQGIYIQFLIAVINYISAINSRNAGASALKKVIFIDNPFGAAKDIYIWEPIFALLKANNVQLIVPARGATPAITGKFDVNYVLGQKLIGGRQQTVVVDYHSNVTIDEVEYKHIEFEQEVFDFV